MPHQASILLVEDEPRIAEVMLAYLNQAGYQTRHIDHGEAVLPAIHEAAPDLLVLDLMLPGKDGVAICRELRAFSSLPVIMVTARVEEIDRLLGFEVGADDYLCKPFSPRELVARVHALLKRSRPAPASGQIESALFTVNESSQRIACAGNLLDLTPREFQLLRYLVSQPGRVFSRAQLIELAYTDASDVFDRVVDTHVKNLRRKIAEHLPEREVIHSVYGVGYRFEV
ncbi:response regulator [Parachitinimonas caeni]|uniref:Response regulator n=1 Tax=Parachitinimonas caeni TaxID=3031301 RepID=A0ABT7DXG0_9NEIS|nr:response regulator [Parachitinimonas caeni]MDK2124757.1 response regulator [Parachitinimonas caeni]